MRPEDSMDVRRSAEASDWLVWLRDEPDSEAAVNGWLRWCESDPANAAAFERVQRMWRQMDQAFASEPDPRPAPELSSCEPSFPGRIGTHRYERASESPPPSRRSWQTALGLALAASIAAAAIFLWMPQFGAPDIPLPTTARENRTATLPDGSLVELGAKTSVAVEFSDDRRLLRLSPGQAYFKVQPDEKRPFTVHAGQLEVTAVGTAFDVKHQTGSIVVTVQEGIVAVGSPRRLRELGEDAIWRVTGGYQFVYSEAKGTATLSSVDTSAVLAWREGRLEYTRTPLAVVVADINRYSLHPVEIEGSTVAALTFTGTVFTDSIDGWLTALPGALPVQVRRTSDGKVLLRGANEAVSTASP